MCESFEKENDGLLVSNALLFEITLILRKQRMVNQPKTEIYLTTTLLQ